MSRHPVVPVVVLASVSIAGLVGMLVVDGALDSAFLLLAAVPLLVGGWRGELSRHDTAFLRLDPLSP